MFTSSLYGWRFIFGSEFLLVCYACYTHIHIFNNFMVYHNGMLGVYVFVIIQPAQPSKTTNQLECEVAQWQNVWFLSPFFPWFIHNIGIHIIMVWLCWLTYVIPLCVVLANNTNSKHFCCSVQTKVWSRISQK